MLISVLALFCYLCTRNRKEKETRENGFMLYCGCITEITFLTKYVFSTGVLFPVPCHSCSVFYVCCFSYMIDLKHLTSFVPSLTDCSLGPVSWKLPYSLCSCDRALYDTHHGAAGANESRRFQELLLHLSWSWNRK